VVHGLKGASADMFLDNAEYRNFLFREFGVSTIDEESASVVMVKFYTFSLVVLTQISANISVQSKF
jgi:hypothetical protein